MKIGTLIEELQRLNPDLDIFITDKEGFFDPVQGTYITEAEGYRFPHEYQGKMAVILYAY